MEEIDVAFAPVRSGHVAFDGVWFKLKGAQIVLLVAFNPKTLDVINAVWGEEEDSYGYEALIAKVTGQMGIDKIKAIYSDGDNGFLKARTKIFPHIPYQVCVFHKELRMGQIVPGDFDEIYNMWNDAGLSLFSYKNEKREFDQMLAINPDTCFVAIYKNRIIGSIFGTTNGCRGFIFHLAVHPD